MAVFLKPEFESITRFSDSDENGENSTWGINVIKYADGRIQIQDDAGIDFFADHYTEFPDGRFIARNSEHEFIYG